MTSQPCELNLFSLIESATCIQDLTPLLNIVFSLDEMKNLTKKRVSIMDIHQKQDSYLKVSPMDEVLPHCIVQYVIGFNEDLRTIQLVNQTFHECCDSAQRLWLRQQHTNWQAEFTPDHRIINVYPSAHYNTLPLAIEHAQSGDTLIIHQGVYEFQQEYELDKNIKLIGYGSNVIIKACNGRDSQTLLEISFNAQYMYLQNVTFEIDDTFWMCVQGEVHLFCMENCVIHSDSVALSINLVKAVKIKNCFFMAARRRFWKYNRVFSRIVVIVKALQKIIVFF
eukprot:62727_1